MIPGSVIGFTAYLTLVGRMGPERAAYCTVLFPVVALNVSAFAEGYQWTAPALAGLVLVMLGNVLVFRKPKRTIRIAEARANWPETRERCDVLSAQSAEHVFDMSRSLGDQVEPSMQSSGPVCRRRK